MNSTEIRRRNIRRLLSPRHVAFVGGEWMAGPIAQCVANGFSGSIWPVSPKHETIGGIRCFPSVADLPEAPDVSFLAVPREATVDVVRALSLRGAGGVVCYAAGFAEVGPEGAALQESLVEAAGDLALVGPNCYGLLNFVDGVVLFASAPSGARVRRGAAFVGQSGNMALNVTFNQRSVPFAYVISSGNQAVLGIEDYVDALVDDPAVSAIALYIEGLADVPAFARAALLAAERGKPIIALKAGRSELGAKLAMSHTSSLAGDDKLYSALFERVGVVRVKTLPALLETTKLLAVNGPPGGGRLAVFTCSGGDGLLAADRAAEIGLALPALSNEQIASLRRQLPAFATIANPLDYNTSLWGRGPELERCFSTVMAGDYDAGMLVVDYPPGDPDGRRDCDISVDSLIEAGKRHGKPVMAAATLAEALPQAARERMIERGAAPLQGLEDALGAFAAVARMAERHAELRRDPLRANLPPTAPAKARRILLGEWQSKQRLKEFGLPLPRAELVRAEDAVAAAERVGFPVVAKIGEPAIAHKTEAGAVRLDLGDGAAVGAAVSDMIRSVECHDRGFAVERILIERQVQGAVAELIVGVKRDEQFGLVLVVGAGGVMAELLDDSAALLLPTGPADVERAIAGLKVAQLIDGFRGRPAGDLGAVVDAVMGVAAYAESERGRLVELDVNPLLVLPRGQGVVAADAMIVLGADVV
jgi:acyl-CoA synthetase (NDP forming)